MKTQQEIERLRDKVNEGNRPAEVVYDTLRWVIGEEPESPATTHVLGEGE